MSTLVALGRAGAFAIREAFETHRRAFRAVTERARVRFATRDWAGGQDDALDRLDLYPAAVGRAVGALQYELGPDLHDIGVWREAKRVHAEAIAGFPDVELAETFFNSVTRRVFTTVGVDPRLEFVDLDPRRDRYGHGSDVHRTFEQHGGMAALAGEALAAADLGAAWKDRARDAGRVARALERAWQDAGHPGEIDALDLLEPVFYRGRGAYLVGRARGGGAFLPLVLVLVHGEDGVEADAVLATEREVSIVFSFTRSHFHVEISRPADVVRFLASILPRKPLAELYISLGYPKHGKTELYRDLVGHLRRSMDPFEPAPGAAGMVMVVFTLRSHPYVLKVIRDRFAPPKRSTRADVVGRYRLVFRHDRAGRLIEAQEFEHLVFDRRRFTPELLEELLSQAGETVSVDGEEVHVRHLYVERRVRPLDLFLREADEQEAAHAVSDYGQALRDLAATNIFPGDLLLKNFGLTRFGRVIFYDYDELCLVTECNFRDLPPPQDEDEEMSAEPWFYVGDHDVFPEELLPFLGLSRPLRERFLAEHGEVLTPGFWRRLQEDHRARRIHDVLPYPPATSLRRGEGGGAR